MLALFPYISNLQGQGGGERIFAGQVPFLNISRLHILRPYLRHRTGPVGVGIGKALLDRARRSAARRSGSRSRSRSNGGKADSLEEWWVGGQSLVVRVPLKVAGGAIATPDHEAGGLLVGEPKPGHDLPVVWLITTAV